jgi:hypothetical protein
MMRQCSLAGFSSQTLPKVSIASSRATAIMMPTNSSITSTSSTQRMRAQKTKQPKTTLRKMLKLVFRRSSISSSISSISSSISSISSSISISNKQSLSHPRWCRRASRRSLPSGRSEQGCAALHPRGLKGMRPCGRCSADTRCGGNTAPAS